MKVFKVVAYGDVERFTMDGWELDKVLSRSYADRLQCSTPVATQAPDGCYGSVSNSFRDEPIQVQEPLFLLFKDFDTLSKEKLLEDRVKKDVLELDDLKKRTEQWEMTAKNLQREVEGSKAVAAIAREKWDQQSALAQKLEAHISKLRIAIGDLRMKEIIDAK
jgi:hypothetical protein